MSTTLAAKYLTDEHVADDFAVQRVDGLLCATLRGTFGRLQIAQGDDAGTLIGELALVSAAAAAIIAQIESEDDFPAYSFMVWINEREGAIKLGSALALTNPDRGTRAALGGMHLAIEGPGFRFTTDAYAGLNRILAFARAVYTAAFLSDRWLEDRYKYIGGVSGVLTKQADKIELYGDSDERAMFGLEIGPKQRNRFAGVVDSLIVGCKEWGTLSGEGFSLDSGTYFLFVRLKTECLSSLLSHIGNTLAAFPDYTVTLLTEEEAREAGCPTL